MITLSRITKVHCLSGLKTIDENDTDTELSTFIYDRQQWHRCLYFSINGDHLNTYGYAVLKEAISGLWLIWISLYKRYRGKLNGAKALYVVSKYAYEKLHARQLMSEVDDANEHSKRAHSAIVWFDPEDEDNKTRLFKDFGILRHLDMRGVNRPIRHFQQTRKQFELGVTTYARIIREEVK